MKIIRTFIISFLLMSCGGGKISSKGIDKEVEVEIKNMVTSVSIFYNSYGYIPSDCYEEMYSSGMIENNQSVIHLWDFECDWEFDEIERSFVGTITAMSVINPRNFIEYDIALDKFTVSE